ncbi:DUF3231 family protein [Niallia oryzisoli]|uniref:DUF3231 family protein n=1 Tax=Niallia oryzisoli TaxID=1737571 RepID=UPI003735CEEA
MGKDSIKLTAPEISSLWTQYLFDTMSIGFMKYALEHLEDEDIIEIYTLAMEYSEKHVQKIEELLREENFPIPQGFTEEDVDIHAPRLFQDPFYLHYMYIMAMQGITGYALSLSTSIRSDIRNYYIDCNKEVTNLFEKTIDALLTKGLFSRPPVITPAESTDFVHQQSFLTGWIGKRRPLTAMEIGDITFNMNKMNMHVALKVGFCQVAQSERVRQYINRGREISDKHIEVFDSIFREEKLNSPISWQALVTNSTTSPFSDKFMMYQVQLSTQLAIAYYGTALSVTARRDLALKYVTLTSELLRFAEDGTNLMIDMNWLEEPPTASDRRALTKSLKVK